jgi:hypothetical protein
MAAGKISVDEIRKKSAASINIADPISPITAYNTALDGSAVAGKKEYDGACFYKTPTTGNRAVDAIVHFTSNVADFTMANSNAAQSPFEAARDVMTVPGSMTYEMEGLLQITGMGGTTRTTALEFDAGGCSLTSISYFAQIWTGAANAIPSASGQIHAVAATAQVMNATVATAAATIKIKGIVRINAGGTFIPQVKFSADPTGTIKCLKDSYFKLTPLGSNTVGSVGNWA